MAAGSRLTAARCVLLHGAWMDGSVWAGVIAELQADEVDVVAPGLPLRGLADDARYVADVVAEVDGPVLLVGLGFGAAVAGVAADLAPNVHGLVAVAGAALEVGESALDVLRQSAGPLLDAFDPRRRSDGALEILLDAEAYPGLMAADLPRSAGIALGARQRAITETALGEPAGRTGWARLPCWYVVAAADALLDPSLQRRLAARVAAEQSVVHGSHCLPLSRPAETAEVIREAARGLA